MGHSELSLHHDFDYLSLAWRPQRKPQARHKRNAKKSVLRLPDLDHGKTPVVNSLTITDANGVMVTLPIRSEIGIFLQPLHAKGQDWHSIRW
jgi:hypothetical protein